jgi:hypothetical protein
LGEVNAVISSRVGNETRLVDWPWLYHGVHIINRYIVRSVEERMSLDVTVHYLE